MTSSSGSNSLTHSERSRLVSYMVEASKEVDRLDAELKRLEPYEHHDIKAYRQAKIKGAARLAMLHQIHDSEEVLKKRS